MMDLSDVTIETGLIRGVEYNYRIAGTVTFEAWYEAFGISDYLSSADSTLPEGAIRVTYWVELEDLRISYVLAESVEEGMGEASLIFEWWMSSWGPGQVS